MAALASEKAQTLKLNEQQWANLRNQLVQIVRVPDGLEQLEFRCETPAELWRARTLEVKEAGTVEWIRKEVKPGQVFYDVGANIGLYTLLASRRVGTQGMVYAFEPHVGNVQSLLHNVSRNGLLSRTKIISCALHEKEGFFDFNYYSAGSGSSMSQLDDTRDANDQRFQPAFSEYKYATTIDRLIETGAIRPADHLKLDVDGNEMLILRGMRKLLAGRGLKSIQVEVNVRFKAELYSWMDQHGYALALRHDTQSGKKAIAAGQDPESIGYNAIFRPQG
jgi:FkbM family methyltransferase